MQKLTRQQFFNSAIALVWLVNGLYCKVLNQVPRHQVIVARILGPSHAPVFTILIGLAEICMAVWIIWGIWPRLNKWVQIVVIATMNLIEFFLASDLLLWGRANIIFAFAFIVLIYFQGAYLNRKPALQI
jgi:DoxX-like family